MLKKDREEAVAVAEINSFNNNLENKVEAADQSVLRNRRCPTSAMASANGGHDEAAVQSAVTDIERTTSMRGITVLRGQGFGDEHVESYL